MRHRTTLTVACTALMLVAAGAAVSRNATPAAPSTASVVAASTYEVDAVHSGVFFRIRHAGLASFIGRFNDLKGVYTFDPDNLAEASFDFSVAVASVDTANQNRDDHLRSPDFFNARQFPTVTFRGDRVEHVADERYRLHGNLTLHGVTRPITADLKWLGTGRFRQHHISAFEAEMEIQRSDFGMTLYVADDLGESGVLGNTVSILITVEGQAKH